MSEKRDDIRFPKSVEMECKGQGWPCRDGGWVRPFDTLDPRLPNGPMICDDCQAGKNTGPVYATYRMRPDATETVAEWSQSKKALEDEIPHLDANERYRGVPVTPKRVGPWVGSLDDPQPQAKPN